MLLALLYSISTVFSMGALEGNTGMEHLVILPLMMASQRVQVLDSHSGISNPLNQAPGLNMVFLSAM